MIKTENFKYNATIDWIELEIATVDKSNFQSMKRAAGIKFVEAINAEDSGASKNFKLKYHDITSWHVLEKIVDELNYIKPLSDVRISGVEISFDAYSIKNDRNELIEKTAEFYWFLQKPCSVNRRVVTSYKGSAEQLLNHQSTIRRIDDGYSILIGSQKDDLCSQRIYYKTIDSKTLLPIQEHRARYEITLIGDACPFHTIEEAKAYKFSDLKEWFKFRKIKENISSTNLMLTKASRQLGSINGRRRTGGGVRVNSYGTQANVTLNRIAYDKLRGLTKRLQSKHIPRKLRVINIKNTL